MRNTFLLFAVLVALFAAADERFYIEDFTVTPGETLTVSILLENAAQYTAFQTDVYLPEGLTVDQEDGDYIFDLTSRKSRDHNIAARLQQDGSIRLMSYSPSIKPYSGNSGALVTFSVTASDGFVGPTTIALRNSLFSTIEGSEVHFADEVCTVTVPSSLLVGDVDGDGRVTIGDVVGIIDMLVEGRANVADYPAADVDGDGRITIGDVTALIDRLLN